MRLPDLSEHTPPEEPVAFERLILPRFAKLFILCVVVAVGAEVGKSYLTNIERADVRMLRMVLHALSTGAVGFGILSLIYTIASAASIKRHELEQRGVRRTAIRAVVIAGLVLVVLALFLFLPFCLGSLSEGTYDCIPLARRMVRAVNGK